MQTGIYLILGYGIPKDIFSDIPYQIYLTQCFNRIYADIELSRVTEPHIILCGGATALDDWDKTTEAEEMKKWMLQAMKRAKVSGWHIWTERTSISTLENIMFARKVIEQQRISGKELHIFSEQTRAWRVSQLVERVFVGYGYEVHGVDFDTTPRRYMGLEKLLEFERLYCSFDIDALTDPEVYTEHHAWFTKKFEVLRTTAPEERTAVFYSRAEQMRKELQQRYG